jgi:hypothetical protein
VFRPGEKLGWATRSRVYDPRVKPLPPDEPATSLASTSATVRIELTCLQCGELAGFLENQRVVRPRVPGSMRFDGRRLTCGRCGSMVIRGEEDRF